MDTRRFKRGTTRSETPRHTQLTRSAGGKLRPAANSDIGDVWAQQRRIQLAEAIEAKKQEAAKRRLRRERGLVGLAKTELTALLVKLKTLLFGTQPLARPKLASPRLAKAKRQTTSHLKQLRRQLTARRRKLSFTVAAIVAAIAIGGGYVLFNDRPDKSQTSQTAETKTASPTRPKNGVLEKGTPNYPTVVPAGKDIEALGGWTRVSPPDSNAVYAFADKLGGIQISVSQQPLPADFRKDTVTKIRELAKSYTATKELVAGETVAYIGTSAKGPQSLILSKENLLVLIKSAAPIKDDQWVSYINSLR